MMMNNTTLDTLVLKGDVINMQDMQDMQFAQKRLCQGPQGGGSIQTSILGERHFQLRRSAVTDPNFILGPLSKDTGRGRLRGSLDAYVKTCQRWKLEPENQRILLGYEPHDAAGRHVLSGNHIPLSQDFRDRIAYILRISLGLGSVFNEAVEAELNWLNKTRPELNDKSAFDYMLEGHMSNLFVIADLVEHERGL